MWHSPEAVIAPWGWDDLGPWQVCMSLRDMGAFTRDGLNIASSVWSQTDFKDSQHWGDTRRLTFEMLQGLEKSKLITEAAHEDQVRILYEQWQLPMSPKRRPRSNMCPPFFGRHDLQAQML